MNEANANTSHHHMKSKFMKVQIPLPTSCASHCQLASCPLSQLRALPPLLGCGMAQTWGKRSQAIHILELLPAAAADVAHSQVIGFPSKPMHVPPGLMKLPTRSLLLKMLHLVQMRGSRPKGNSGRSMKPCLPASGVWNARGWMDI